MTDKNAIVLRFITFCLFFWFFSSIWPKIQFYEFSLNWFSVRCFCECHVLPLRFYCQHQRYQLATTKLFLYHDKLYVSMFFAITYFSFPGMNRWIFRTNQYQRCINWIKAKENTIKKILFSLKFNMQISHKKHQQFHNFYLHSKGAALTCKKRLFWLNTDCFSCKLKKAILFHLTFIIYDLSSLTILTFDISSCFAIVNKFCWNLQIHIIKFSIQSSQVKSNTKYF